MLDRSNSIAAAQQRIVAVLFAAQGLFSATTIATFTLSGIIATDLAGSEGVVGWPNALGLIGRVAIAYPFGYLMDQIGRRWSLSLGYSLAIIGCLASIWAISAGNFFGFLLGALFIGMSRSAGDQSRYVGAEVFRAERRAKVIGIIVMAGTVGAILGPLLVPLSTSWTARIGLPEDAGPFLVSSLLMLVATATVFLFLRPDPQEIGLAIAQETAANEPQSLAGPADTDRTLREIFAEPMVQLAVVSMVLSYFVMAMLMVVTPLHMDKHNHSYGAISGVISAHTLGMFAPAWFTGWLVDRFGRVQIIVAGTAVLGLSCLLAPLSLQLPVVGLALFLLGLGWNFCYIAGSALLSDTLAANERGRGQGASEVMVALGTLAASVSTGVLFQQGQFILVSVVGLAGSLLLLAVTIVLVRRSRLQTVVASTG